MTARDTHELRFSYWPRLSTFPTTNALVATVIFLAVGTFIAWAVFNRTPPDGWYLFVGGLSGIATAHFGVKRKTQFHDAPKNGGTDAPPG